MRKSIRLIAVTATVGALAAVAATPASAGQPAPGSVYKGAYTWGGGMTDSVRVKVYESGKAGNFSLKCAGIRREKIEINRRGVFRIEFGADRVLVKGKGKFGSKGRIRGDIDKIAINGAECAAPGEFALVIADV